MRSLFLRRKRTLCIFSVCLDGCVVAFHTTSLLQLLRWSLFNAQPGQSEQRPARFKTPRRSLKLGHVPNDSKDLLKQKENLLASCNSEASSITSPEYECSSEQHHCATGNTFSHALLVLSLVCPLRGTAPPEHMCCFQSMALSQHGPFIALTHSGPTVI